MSKFLDYLSSNTHKDHIKPNEEDTEGNNTDTIQLSELWEILNNININQDHFNDYINRWKNFHGKCTVESLCFDRFGPHGFKPLHWCCYQGTSCEFIELLLSYGLNVNDDHGSAAGETPLLLAVMYGHVHIVRLLIDKGARLDIMDKFGNFPRSVVEKKLRRVRDLQKRELYHDILKALDRVYHDDVDKAHTLRQEGNTYFRNGEYKRAIAKYSDSLKLSEDARAYSNRAQCYIELGRMAREKNNTSEYVRKLYSLGLEDAVRAKTMSPMCPKGHYRYALCAMGCGLFLSALRSIRVACSEVPRSQTNRLLVLYDDLCTAGVPVDYGSDVNIPTHAISRNVGVGSQRNTGKQRSTGNLHIQSCEGSLPEHADNSSEITCVWCETPLGLPVDIVSSEPSNNFSEGKCKFCKCPINVDSFAVSRLREKYLDRREFTSSASDCTSCNGNIEVVTKTLT